jgi:hypothetical protein
MEELARALEGGALTAEERAQLRERAIDLARAVHQRHGTGPLSAAKGRLEEAALRVAVKAPLATGIVRQIIDTLASIGI